MDKQQLQKIEQASILAGMLTQLNNIVRSSEDQDFSDCPDEFVDWYNCIAKTCEGLMDDIRKYVVRMFNGEGEG